ncbi:TetR/AcrR family transcriptional regulator [Weissella viridescens]|uniref:TetR/AcrR family transcriptional regulator n=1 Tax=Weissella viridescens TaxID=1629 RepID=A0A3P2RMN2_WEIVI|nr:TetR/AcrR family transcriptional regulator [Weissella viridescens]RRG18778.1 TetR/AcrR family transcriptional regulator [Weissella viridescens]
MTEPKQTERRTKTALLNDVYQAALVLGNELGYNRITFSEISKRANVTRATLYRHWQSPFGLLYAAVQYYSESHPNQVQPSDFEQQSLRQNLITALMRFESSFRSVPNPDSFMAYFVSEIVKDVPENREILAELKTTNRYYMNLIIDVALAKQELQQRPSDFLLNLPMETLIYQMGVNHQRISEKLVTMIVDQMLIPTFESQAK